MTEAAPLVFVVDDDTAIREAIGGLLRSVGLPMKGFASPAEFLSSDRPDAPSCLVLDVRLPGCSGLEFQRELAAAKIDIPIIFITGHADVPMSVRAMKAGAVEFLGKPFRDQELLDAVQLAIAKDRENQAQRQVLQEISARAATLTDREREVMELLTLGKLNKQIGAEIGATESTVKAHRTQIMRKMGAASLAELVRMSDKLSAASAP